MKTAFVYDVQTRQLNNLTATSQQGNTRFQNLFYSYDKVGNILGLKNDVALPRANDYGGPSMQQFQYDDLYRLTKGQGVFPADVSKTTADVSACNGVPTSHCHVYSMDMTYDTIHNIQRKNQVDTRYPPGGSAIVQKKVTYDFAYAYNASGPNSSVDRQAFVPQLTADMLAASSGQSTKKTHVWEFAQTAWEKEAFKIYEANLVASVPDDLPLIGGISSAERIKDIVEPHKGVHEVVLCHVMPTSVWQKAKDFQGDGASERSFLGHDIAYPGGDFYSAILNGLFRNPHPRLMQKFRSKLNKLGLFDNLPDAVQYLEEFRNLVPTEKSSEFVLFTLFVCRRKEQALK